jgi:hypothetical protein
MCYGHNYANQLGIPNANVDNINSGFPSMLIAGVTSVGESGAYPDISIEHAFQYLDNLTLIRGGHTLKVGADIRRLRQTFFQLLGGDPGGTFNFDQYMTGDPGNVATTGNAMGIVSLGNSGFRQLGSTDGQCRDEVVGSCRVLPGCVEGEPDINNELRTSIRSSYPQSKCTIGCQTSILPRVSWCFRVKGAAARAC